MNRQGRFHRTLSLLGLINKGNLTISYLLDKFDHIFWTGTGNDLEKLNWFCLTGLITLVQLIWKWVGLFLRKNHLWRCWGCLSLLNWIGALTLSLLLKLPPRNLEPWFVLWSFSPDVGLYRCKSTIQPCMEHCCHVCTGAPSFCLEMLDNIQKRIYRIVVTSLAASLESLAYRQNIASLSFFYRSYFVRCSYWLNWFHFW